MELSSTPDQADEGTIPFSDAEVVKYVVGSADPELRKRIEVEALVNDELRAKITCLRLVV